MNILHLSDIHFGRDKHGIAEPFSNKSQILEQLIAFISSLDNSAKPDLVLTTGDIAWYGLKSEFDEAFTWYQKLKSALALSNDRFVFCPGNHDLNRNTAVSFSENELLNDSQKLSIEKCDYYYEYEQSHILEARFHNYNVFCENMGMQPYSYKLKNGQQEYSYLIGSSQFQINGQSFILSSFNTAYLPYGNILNDDQMFLGLPQIKSLLECKNLSPTQGGSYRIALFHHADRFLHPNEQSEYDGRTASLPLLLSSVNLALCGHTETGGVPVLRKYHNGGKLLTAGAAYYNDTHPNSFSIINIDNDYNTYVHSYYYDGKNWIPFASNPSTLIASDHAPLSWNDPLQNHKKLGFGVYIDEKLKIIYHGYFDVRYIESVNGPNMLLNNLINPARPLDIITELSDETALPTLKIQHAPGQLQTTSSLLMMSTFRKFIADNIQNAKTAFSGWYELENGINLVTYVPMDIDRMKQAYKDHIDTTELYEKLQKIEHHFGVQFKLPTPFSLIREDIEIVNWLYEILEHGSLSLLISDILESSFVVHNFDEITWIRDVYKTGGTLAYHYSRELTIHLYNASIKLGKCQIYCSGATVKSIDEVERKISTWEHGDLRTISTDFKNGENLLIIPEKYANGTVYSRDPNTYVVSFPSDAPLLFNEFIKKYISEPK